MLGPALPDYLNRAYEDKRGGTLIVEDVWDLEEHRKRLLTPGGYRPAGCPVCGGFLVGHGCRFRQFRDQSDSAGEEIRRYRCRPCQIVWQVLPAFIARYLHRTWGAIQSRLVAGGQLEATGAEWHVRPKPSTLRRWSLRITAVATVLTQGLVESGGAAASAVAGLGSWCSRGELVEGLVGAKLLEKRRKLGQLSCWIHRIVPGVRVM